MDWVTVGSVCHTDRLANNMYVSVVLLDIARNESDKYQVPSFSKRGALLNGNYIVE